MQVSKPRVAYLNNYQGADNDEPERQGDNFYLHRQQQGVQRSKRVVKTFFCSLSMISARQVGDHSNTDGYSGNIMNKHSNICDQLIFAW